MMLLVSTASATTVYCKMDKAWWTQDGAAVAVHHWGGETAATNWPGVRMAPVAGEEGMWSYDVPADVTGLMFVRVNGEGDIADWGAKTADLTLPTDGKNLYTITSEEAVWGDPGCNGEWSVYPKEMQVIYDWAGEIGTTVLGPASVEISTVKIHTNTDEVPAIKFSSSYVYADGKWIAIKPAVGGFKAGDVINVALVFNNADDTKYAQIDLRAANGDTRIWLSDSASTINGRTNAGEPIVQTYTLEADQDSLFLGRYGNTGMFVTMLKVERAGGVTPEPVLPSIALIGGMNGWDGSKGEFVAAADKASASLTLDLAEMPQDAGYAFKLLVDGVAYGSERVEGNPFTFTRENNVLTPVDHVAVGDDEIFWLVMDVTGEYTFTYTFADSSLVVTYPEVSHTYTVAGDNATIFGTTWDVTNTANDMELQEDNTYKWEKENLELPVGNIAFKVAQDHSWSVNWPSENYVLAIAESGSYTITITFNAETKEVAAVATKTGDADVTPSVAMHGDFNKPGWADTENFTIAEDKASASLTLTLAADRYKFGMRIGGSGNWTANGAQFSRENPSAEVVAGSGNLVLTTDVEGDYTFTWTYETNTLTITFPAKEEGISNTVVDVKVVKTIENGQLVIIKNGVKYNVQGAQF